ncbi:DUF4837 family protein [Pontimicrobium sp. SW4]|uniref:DUF4837 family protein n=1 Tax=Pontimicrobium sp. SW4 TaxID=3153519 RepID=A0AAU7BSC7_9FLAO
MKKLLLIMLSVSLLTSCGDGSKSKRIVSSSSGNINNLQVIVDSDLWLSRIGDELREVFSAEVLGLPQQEPLFSIRQMPPIVFTDFATKNRTILKIERDKPADTKFLKDVYATPQAVVVISGNSAKEIIAEINEHAERIISTFKATEIKEQQRRMSKSLLKINSIEEALGITLSMSSAYRIAKEEGNFFWLRRDIKNGDANLMIYEMPLDAISDGENAINDIIKMRDSIGKAHIPGPIEGSYMITEEAYTPYLNTTIIDNKPAFETKSTWEVKDAFMAGPFINYAIKDEVNNRLLVLEGFVFAPSTGKRDYIFELEAIIRSLKIK